MGTRFLLPWLSRGRCTGFWKRTGLQRGSHRASGKAWMVPAQDRIASCNTGRREVVREEGEGSLDCASGQEDKQPRKECTVNRAGVDIPSQRRDPHPDAWEETQRIGVRGMKI